MGESTHENSDVKDDHDKFKFVKKTKSEQWPNLVV